MDAVETRPRIVSALGIFFACGAAISALSFLALLLSGSFLAPMWRLNPRAHEQLAAMGVWGMLLMAVVSVACALASYGLWRGRRFGLVLGLAMLAVSFLGDLANALLGIEPRAWVGVPIAAALFVTLATRRSRAFFSRAARVGSR